MTSSGLQRELGHAPLGWGRVVTELRAGDQIVGRWRQYVTQRLQYQLLKMEQIMEQLHTVNAEDREAAEEALAIGKRAAIHSEQLLQEAGVQPVPSIRFDCGEDFPRYRGKRVKQTTIPAQPDEPPTVELTARKAKSTDAKATAATEASQVFESTIYTTRTNDQSSRRKSTRRNARKTTQVSLCSF